MGVPAREDSAGELRVDVLGPLRVIVGGEEVAVPGPKRRALLALLVHAGGRAVPVDDLLAQLWSDELPDAARASLQSHVSRLRGHLGDAAARLERTPDGYRLDLAAGDTDVGLARAALDVGAPAEREALAAARALWRGEPLTEFPDVPVLAAWAAALGELRRRLDHAHADAVLDTGTPEEAIEAATALVAADPLADAPVRSLMRALHRAGRSPEALRAAYDHRRRLREETGLGPGPELVALEGEIASATRRDPGQVPRSPHRLWGRDAELAALRGLVATHALVTVVGPGGVGKTRLACEVAGAAEPATAVLLAAVAEPDDVPAALAEALDLQVLQGDALQACSSILAAGPHVLLLDGCEHVLAGVRRVVDALLSRCPLLTILATSREPLAVPGEQRLRLSPLEVSRPESPGAVSSSPAVAVFVDRARQVRPDLELSGRALDAITDIARRLDGMPLALGLAAGRLSSMGVVDLQARLDRALDLLGDEPGGTLRQAIAWSYDLLRPDDQRLLRHLSAFPGGVDLATGERLAEQLGLDPVGGPAVARIADASMLELSPGPATRYRLLETVRAFAWEQLEVLGEVEAATGSFRSWGLELAAWTSRTMASDAEALGDAALRAERANLRAVWAQLRVDDQVDDAARLLLDLDDLAGWRDLTEVWEWTLELAEDPRLVGHRAETAVLGVAAGSAWARGELDRAAVLADRGLAAGGDDAWRCIAAQAMVALSRGDLATAVDLGTVAGEQASRPNQAFGVAALAAAYAGDAARARTLVPRLATSSPTVAAFASYVTGEIDALDGRPDDAQESYEAAITGARSVGATLVEALAAVGVQSARAQAGRVVEALEGYLDLIGYWERTGGWVQQWTTLRNLARLLASCGDTEPALLLTAAAASAPDAPPEPEEAALVAGRPADWVVQVRRRGATATRAEVLRVARDAIDARLALLTKPAELRT